MKKIEEFLQEISFYNSSQDEMEFDQAETENFEPGLQD